MGRVQQVIGPKSWLNSCSCISLPRLEPQFASETTNFLDSVRKKKIYEKVLSQTLRTHISQSSTLLAALPTFLLWFKAVPIAYKASDSRNCGTAILYQLTLFT